MRGTHQAQTGSDDINNKRGIHRHFRRLTRRLLISEPQKEGLRFPKDKFRCRESREAGLGLGRRFPNC